VVAIGGEIRPVSLALIGDLALDWLKHLRFDVAVIGASGIDPIEGPSTTELSEAAVKQLACDRASKRILVSHSTKWGAPAAITFASWKRFNVFVTDARIPRSAELRREGVSVQIVSL
jgi:DeoR/GlpR family transcriptional regulator of sugar metabolism